MEEAGQAIVLQAFAPCAEERLGSDFIGFQRSTQRMEMLAGMVEVDDLDGVLEAVSDQIPYPLRAVTNEDGLAGRGVAALQGLSP